MSKIVLCPEGHYYDSEKTKECPYCKEAQSGSNKTIHIPKEDIDISIMLETPTEGENKVHIKKADKGQTVSENILKWEHSPQFTTGWLVGRKGATRGFDFRVRAGRNWMGSGNSDDIWISGDPSVKGRHCEIIYDDRSNAFFIKNGDGGNYTLLNGTPVRSVQQLNTGDQIQTGSCVFEFVAFCREGHTWRDE